MDFHYPTSVEPLDNYCLLLTFDNGDRRIFDVKPYLDDSFFSPLKNKTVFRTVHINPLTVEWAGGIDIAPEELYLDSKPLNSVNPGSCGRAGTETRPYIERPKQS